jgi:hypothetical protein
LIYVVATT